MPAETFRDCVRASFCVRRTHRCVAKGESLTVWHMDDVWLSAVALAALVAEVWLRWQAASLASEQGVLTLALKAAKLTGCDLATAGAGSRLQCIGALSSTRTSRATSTILCLTCTLSAFGLHSLSQIRYGLNWVPSTPWSGTPLVHRHTAYHTVGSGALRQIGCLPSEPPGRHGAKASNRHARAPRVG